MLWAVNTVWRKQGGTSKRLMLRYISNNSNNNSRWNSDALKAKHMKIVYYMGAFAVLTLATTYASVPLYKVFCQMTGIGGVTQRASEVSAATVEQVGCVFYLLVLCYQSETSRRLKIDFQATVHRDIPWRFTPTQSYVKVLPGETALAFYTVRNPTNKTITGVATYNVDPPRAGLYFNKIQCFCFEEQRIGPYEEVDMPVFFFIDPEYLQDKYLKDNNNIMLSYTFFKTGEEEPETVIKKSATKDKEEKKTAVLQTASSSSNITDSSDGSAEK